MIKTNLHTIDEIVNKLGRQICGFNLLTWQIYWKSSSKNKNVQYFASGKGIPGESIQGTYRAQKN